MVHLNTWPPDSTNIHLRDLRGWSPLIVAPSLGHTRAVGILLNWGGDLSIVYGCLVRLCT